MTENEKHETEKRRDDALRRALNTPPKPKPSGKESESPDKKGKREKPSD